MTENLRPATFAEREGFKPLPTQLALKSLTSEVRARVWSLLHRKMEGSKYIDRSIHETRMRRWSDILRDVWVEIDHKFADEYRPHPLKAIPYAKAKMNLQYGEFLEFLEFCVQHRQSEDSLADELNDVFARCGFAYRFHENHLIPLATEQEGEAVIAALNKLADDYGGAKAHLLEASSSLSKGKYAHSISQSISAVESVSRAISPKSKTLGPALDRIEKYFGLHPALKKGFSSLYGYTSDKEGVRHALINHSEADVDEADALYMLGSCAAFSSYLAARSRSLD